MQQGEASNPAGTTMAEPQPTQRASTQAAGMKVDAGDGDARMLMTTSHYGVVRVRGVSSTAGPFCSAGRDHHGRVHAHVPLVGDTCKQNLAQIVVVAALPGDGERPMVPLVVMFVAWIVFRVAGIAGFEAADSWIGS